MTIALTNCRIHLPPVAPSLRGQSLVDQGVVPIRCILGETAGRFRGEFWIESSAPISAFVLLPESSGDATYWLKNPAGVLIPLVRNPDSSYLAFVSVAQPTPGRWQVEATLPGEAPTREFRTVRIEAQRGVSVHETVVLNAPQATAGFPVILSWAIRGEAALIQETWIRIVPESDWRNLDYLDFERGTYRGNPAHFHYPAVSLGVEPDRGPVFDRATGQTLPGIRATAAGVWVPVRPGRFVAVGEICGKTLSGRRFERQIERVIEVVTPKTRAFFPDL